VSHDGQGGLGDPAGLASKWDLDTIKVRSKLYLGVCPYPAGPTDLCEYTANAYGATLSDNTTYSYSFPRTAGQQITELINALRAIGNTAVLRATMLLVSVFVAHSRKDLACSKLLEFVTKLSRPLGRGGVTPLRAATFTSAAFRIRATLAC
jgi:hypothetical protein